MLIATVKATDFKFEMHVPRESPDVAPLKIFFRKRGVFRVTF